MRRFHHGPKASAVWALLATCAWALPAAAADVPATSADDVCAADEDPCLVSKDYVVVDGADLDFGTRHVLVESGGSLDFSGVTATLRCGTLDVAEGNEPSILAKNGADITIEARNGCSLDAAVPCLVDETCASQQLGACDQPSGSVILDGKIAASGTIASTLTVTAAEDVTLSQTLAFQGTDSDADGGDITLTAVRGSIAIGGKINAYSGGGGAGGSLDVEAAGGVTIHAKVDVTGGEMDGGSIQVSAGTDVILSANLEAQATGGGGSGGDIDIAAGTDLRMEAGGGNDTLLVSTRGHQGSDGWAGDGGDLDFTAGGNLLIGPEVRIRAQGAAPDGWSGAIFVDIVGSLEMLGDMNARAMGSEGEAGWIDLRAGDDIHVGGEILNDAEGNDSGGGSLTLDGCRITLSSSAQVDNDGEWSDITVTAHDTMITEVGSTFTSIGGDIWIDHRSLETPSLEGTVSPPPIVTHAPNILACDVCGNGFANVDEGCGEPDLSCDGGQACGACQCLCGDVDGDGAMPVGCGGDDCDDTDSTVYSGASEICGDDVDQDCDGDDEMCPDPDPDTGSDSGPDTSSDVGPDALADIGPDPSSDVGPDVDPDASHDVDPDVPSGVDPDTSPGVDPDISPGVDSEVSSGADPDSSPDVGAPSTSDIGSETSSDAGPNTVAEVLVADGSAIRASADADGPEVAQSAEVAAPPSGSSGCHGAPSDAPRRGVVPWLLLLLVLVGRAGLNRIRLMAEWQMPFRAGTTHRGGDTRMRSTSP